MLTDGQQLALSDLLSRCWAEGRKLTALPEDMRPGSRKDAYAVQSYVARLSQGPIFGWKIAATSTAGQLHIGVDGPIAGRLLRERRIANGGTCPLKSNLMRVAEPEFAFKMARNIEPRSTTFSIMDVINAVGSIHPAIEIPDSQLESFANVGPFQLIADNACAHDFVLGPPLPEWRNVDLAEQSVTGGTANSQRSGSGSNVLGDPRAALTWLTNELSQLSIPLLAGQVVMTGACFAPVPVVPGDVFEVDFGRFGTVSVQFT